MYFVYHLFLVTDCKSDEVVANSLRDGGRKLASSGMASVMAKILSKNVSSSKSVILARCKTDRESTRRKKPEKGSDSVEQQPVTELQTTKQRKDTIVKVCEHELFCVTS